MSALQVILVADLGCLLFACFLLKLLLDLVQDALDEVREVYRTIVALEPERGEWHG